VRRYKEAGVDIEAGENFARWVGEMAKSTYDNAILEGVGGFASLYRLEGFKKPVLVSGADGVGTKLKVAQMMGKYDTVGIDLVAMCVNDVLCTGAKPLYFIDYFAMGKLDFKLAKQVLSGIVEGCRQADCALIGGETAEMPGMYKEGEVELAGFCVGVVEEDRIVNGKNCKAGDAIIGLASSGFHSNGFSLLRKIFFEEKNFSVNEEIPQFDKTLGEILLEPTCIYVKPVLELLNRCSVHAIAHITGGGMPGNIPRVIPENLRAKIRLGSWEIPEVFLFAQKEGGISEEEMFQVFNMGVGMIVIVGREEAEIALEVLKENGLQAWVIGELEEGERGVEFA